MAARLTGVRAGRVLLPALACLALLACASPPPSGAQPIPAPLPADTRVAELRVALSEALSPGERAHVEAADLPGKLRLAALDWFEHVGRFDRDEGVVRLAVTVKGFSVASQAAAWLWRGIEGDDWLQVEVRVHDALGVAESFLLTEHTSVSGWEWRDADARLDRMTRRLGRRIAELLTLLSVGSTPRP